MKKELHYGCNSPAICNKQEWQGNYQPSKKCADNKCKFVVITDLAESMEDMEVKNEQTNRPKAKSRRKKGK